MAKMAVVVGKSKKKSLNKKARDKKQSKFISQALNNRKKLKGKKKKRPKTKGTVFVKNLPHGFYEEQLRGYFSQFGDVTRIRLGRSPKTLNSRGYAFVEFRYPEVAEIAAQTMNNYIMFHRIVKAKYIPPSETYHDYFRSSIMMIRKDGEKMMTSKTRLAREAVVTNTNSLLTDKDQVTRIEKVRSKVSKQKARLQSLGIDFDVDSIAKNMSEEVIKPRQKKEVITIENINEEDLDDDNDETFDPAKFDINSADEFEDHDYECEESETDEVTEQTKKQTAVEFAKSVSKSQKPADKKPQKAVKKNVKEKKKVEAEVVAEKVTKTGRKAAAKKEVDEKPAKKKLKEVKEAPPIETNVRKLRASTRKVQPEKVVEKVVKEKKNLKTAAAKKKAEKPVSKKESPKQKKVSPVSKRIKKAPKK